MTKRLTIALVALAIFVLVVMVPVSATKMSTGPNYYYNVAQNIGAGATVFIGESHLNLQLQVLLMAQSVGYWASAANQNDISRQRLLRSQVQLTIQ